MALIAAIPLEQALAVSGIAGDRRLTGSNLHHHGQQNRSGPGEETIRIISARKATRKERQRYDQNRAKETLD